MNPVSPPLQTLKASPDDRCNLIREPLIRASISSTPLPSASPTSISHVGEPIVVRMVAEDDEEKS